MKKNCGCADYDKCDHEIAEVGATPKEAKSKDGKQEAQPEMKKGMSFNQLKKEEEEPKKPSLTGPKKEVSEPMKRLKPGVSDTGLPVLSGSAKDIADVLRHHAGTPKAGPVKKDPQMETIKQMAVEIAKEYAKNGKLGFRKSEDGDKPDLSRWHDPETAPSGKKYKDMDLNELDNHILNLWADLSDHFRSDPLKRPKSMKIDGPKAKSSKEAGMKKSDDIEKGIKDLIGKIRSPKKPTGMTPEGKRYEDMSHDELKSHMQKLFQDHHEAETSSAPRKPENLVASEAGRQLDKGDQEWSDKEAGKEYKPSWSKEKNSETEWKDSEVGKEYKPSSSKKKELDKADVIDMKTKAKKPAAKPADKKPDTRSKDEKIKDALASQGEKGSPYANSRGNPGAGSHNAAPKPKFPDSTKPAEPKKPGIHAGMSRQELMDHTNKTPDPGNHADRSAKIRASMDKINNLMNDLKSVQTKTPGSAEAPKPSAPSHLKVIKSLEAMAPSLSSGMSMAELKKAEEQYSAMLSKVEQVLAKGDADAIKVALEKIKGNNK